MQYPTLNLVESATKYQICSWYRFLKSPETEGQIEIMNRIVARYKELGSFTAEISKSLGWEE